MKETKMPFSDSIEHAWCAVQDEQETLPDGHPDKIYQGGRILSRSRFTALVGRQLLFEYRQKGNDLMWFAWMVYRDRLWLDVDVLDPQKANFEDFREWWNYTCDDPRLGITRYSNLRTLTVAFAAGLAPWLHRNQVYDYNNERVTPEIFLERAGHGRVAEINGAWWSHFKSLESLHTQLEIEYPGAATVDDLPFEERNRLQHLQAETNHRMLTSVQLAIDPSLTREAVGERLEELGWRKKRSEEPTELERGWEHTIIPASEKTFIGVWVPNKWVAFFMGLAGKFFSVAPDRPDRIIPEEIKSDATVSHSR